ncbi:PglL family O-oligosaccharyltransferase [Jeongeupia naejangsanensis]|uniref:O-antigen ligase C-terminal domain-containing protein n=1 Tax=Jeongeupia naejangsanensis TaxID=613195 RepID=A0ABS2BJX7_9NEIS|nr:Wzy polymerase domain-containing protein [Jeongeupia naejangsanensis]MBM3115917.1 O-antigen ligase C-terminal domain-containing protein [Jeongeupia naejangsanensis]
MLRVFQVLLFLLAAVPCGIPFRYPPNPVFPSELAAYSLATLLVLAVAGLPTQRVETTRTPWMAIVWFGLAAVLGLQALTMTVPYWSDLTIPALYMVTAGMSVWALARARDEFGIAPLAQALAWGLVVGALFNSAIAVEQIYQLITSGPRLIFGNIGQKNMYGHYLAWGFASVMWLSATGRLPRWLTVTLSLWFALSMAYCGSRSPFLYAVAWLVFGLALAFGRQDVVRRLGRNLMIAGALIIAMQFVAPLINDVIGSLLRSQNEVPTGLDRLDSNGARRLVEWHKAWLTFEAHPLLGVGWGEYPAHGVALQVQPEFAKVVESVLFTHAHNSLLNLMAETGVIGTGIVVLGILAAFFGLWSRRDDDVAMFAAALVAVSILHSLVEYPLWYYHFFGPFALMLFLAFGATPRKGPAVSRGGFALYGIASVAAAVFGGLTYLKIYPIIDPSDSVATNERNLKTLGELRHNPLVDFYADYALSNYITASAENIDWKLGILDRLNAVRPYPGQLSDAAIMHAIKGDAAQAQTLMRQAAFAYPESLDYFRDELARFPNDTRVQALAKPVDEGEAMFGKQKHDGE